MIQALTPEIKPAQCLYALADKLIADKQVSPRFHAHLIEFLHEAYGVRASTLAPDLTCFVNAQSNTYSFQGNSERNLPLLATQPSLGKSRVCHTARFSTISSASSDLNFVKQGISRW